MLYLGPVVLIVWAVVVSVTEAATEVSADPWVYLLNFGVAGLVIFLFVTGQIRTKSEVTQLERQIEQHTKVIAEKNDALREKDQIIVAFQTQLTGSTLPALTHSTRVLEAIPRGEAAMIEEMHRTRKDVAMLVARLEALTHGAEGEEHKSDGSG